MAVRTLASRACSTAEAAARDGGRPTGSLADAVRRKRVHEATRVGASLLGAVTKQPGRLFDSEDARLTAMLWGVEHSTQRLSNAMSRGGAAAHGAAGGGGPRAVRHHAPGSLSARGRPRPHTAVASFGARGAADGAGGAGDADGAGAPLGGGRTSAGRRVAELISWHCDGDGEEVLETATRLHTPVADRLVAQAKVLPGWD